MSAKLVLVVFQQIFPCCLLIRLYAVGGRDGSACLRTVEVYDPHINRWTMCSPMSKRRGGLGVAVCNGCLYAIGGHDTPSQQSSRQFDCVERLVVFQRAAFYQVEKVNCVIAGIWRVSTTETVALLLHYIYFHTQITNM